MLRAGLCTSYDTLRHEYKKDRSQLRSPLNHNKQHQTAAANAMKFSSMSAAQSRSVLAWPIATRLYLVAFFAAMMLCFFSVPAVGSDNPKPPTPKVCCHVQGKW